MVCLQVLECGSTMGGSGGGDNNDGGTAMAKRLRQGVMFSRDSGLSGLLFRGFPRVRGSQIVMARCCRVPFWLQRALILWV